MTIETSPPGLVGSYDRPWVVHCARGQQSFSSAVKGDFLRVNDVRECAPLRQDALSIDYASRKGDRC